MDGYGGWVCIDSLGKRKLLGLSGSTIPAHPSNNRLEMEWTNIKRLNWTFQEPLNWFIYVYIVSVSIPTSHHTREKTSTSAARRTRLWWRNLSTSARSLEISWPWSCDPGGNEHGNCWTLLPFSRATVINDYCNWPTTSYEYTSKLCFRLLSYGIGTPQIWHGHISFWGLPAGSLDSGARILGSMLNLAKPSDNNSFFGIEMDQNAGEVYHGLPLDHLEPMKL